MKGPQQILHHKPQRFLDTPRGIREAVRQPLSPKSQGGYSLIEVILASALFVLLVSGIATAIIYSQQSTTQAGTRNRAAYIAQEGLDAIRNMRDQDFTSLADGTYGIAISNNQWIFSGSQDTTDIFKRQITISTIDDDTKKVVSTVNWQQSPQRQGTLSLSTYFTNWSRPKYGDWSNSFTFASLPMPGGKDSIKVRTQGNYAFAIRNSAADSFVVIDISDEMNPAVVKVLNLKDNPKNIYVEGNYAYIASKHNTEELQIYNIQNPTNPVAAGTLDIPGNSDPFGVFAVGTTVYMVLTSNMGNEFLVIDASNPASAKVVGSTSLGGNGTQVIVIGSYAYVSTSVDNKELQVINISNPTSPTVVGSYDLPGTDDALAVTGFSDTIILGRTDGTMRILDVSTPTTPTSLSTFNVQGPVNDISLGAGNLYVLLATDYDAAEFQVVDISDTSAPSNIGFTNVDDDLNGVSYHAGKNKAVAVGDSNVAGFVIFSPN